jgi:hypothetical protein
VAGLQEYAVIKFDYLKGQYEKNNIVTEGINITHCHFIIYSIISLLKSYKYTAIYYDFIGLLVGALYCTAPQGRIGGIEIKKLAQTHDIYNKKSTMVYPPKTGKKYGYQPVIFTPFCLVIF